MRDAHDALGVEERSGLDGDMLGRGVDPPSVRRDSTHHRTERDDPRRAELSLGDERAVVNRDDSARGRGRDVVGAVEHVRGREECRERGPTSPPRLERESRGQKQPLHLRGDVGRLGPAAHDVGLEVDVVSPVECGQHRLDEPAHTGAGADERRGIDGDPHDQRRYRLDLAGLPGAPKVAG
jgi:hypothetical protein